MTVVITASERALLDGHAHSAESASPQRLIVALRREGADPVRKGRPWSLSLEDRVLLVTAYWRTKTWRPEQRRQLSHGQQRKRLRKDTVLIVDVTLAPTRAHAVAEQWKNYRYSTDPPGGHRRRLPARRRGRPAASR
ncbi:hypothetical protein SAMN02745898_101991 [Streptomyces sp. 136MFCol5.1]|nr:hypothetical protein SAMN02745898_101991 [Streptomyces sp. 136MFCol5.1]